MSGEEYRQHVELMPIQREILRCIMELDVDGIRKVWQYRWRRTSISRNPDWDACAPCMRRGSACSKISPQQKRYSEHWLRELEGKTRIAASCRHCGSGLATRRMLDGHAM